MTARIEAVIPHVGVVLHVEVVHYGAKLLLEASLLLDHVDEAYFEETAIDSTVLCSSDILNFIDLDQIVKSIDRHCILLPNHN